MERGERGGIARRMRSHLKISLNPGHRFLDCANDGKLSSRSRKLGGKVHLERLKVDCAKLTRTGLPKLCQPRENKSFWKYMQSNL